MVKKQMSRRKKLRKGLENKRYRQTEEAIIEVLLKSRTMPSTGEITRRARISRSTLYRHHRAMPGIVPDYEREILKRFDRVVAKISRQKIDLRNAYFRGLVFVVRYKRVFRILFKYSGDRVIERMVLKLGVLVVDFCRLPKNSEKMLRIYAKEVAGIVEMWGERGFKEEEMEGVLGDIMRLTRTMRRDLGRLKLGDRTSELAK